MTTEGTIQSNQTQPKPMITIKTTAATDDIDISTMITSPSSTRAIATTFHTTLTTLTPHAPISGNQTLDIRN